MPRTRTLAIAALAALALTTTACRKVSDSGGAAEVDLAVFPADSDFVLSISLGRLRETALWKGSEVVKRLGRDGALAVCGEDALAKFRTLTVGGELAPEGLVLVLDGVTREFVSTCWAKQADRKGVAFAMQDEDGLTTITEGERTVLMTWLAPTTGLLSFSLDRTWFKARAARQGGLASGSALTALIGEVDREAPIWFVGRATELDGALGAFGSIRVTDGLVADLTLRFDAPASAERAKAEAATLLAQVGPALPPPVATAIGKVALSVAGTDLRVALSLTAAEATALVDALGERLAD